MEVDHENKLKYLYLHKTDNHTTTHGCNKKGGGGWDDDCLPMVDDDDNFLKTNTERVDLGALKGNQGDQNYEVPAGTDLGKFKTVSIFCERFNANFGAAPLQKL